MTAIPSILKNRRDDDELRDWPDEPTRGPGRGERNDRGILPGFDPTPPWEDDPTPPWEDDKPSPES